MSGEAFVGRLCDSLAREGVMPSVKPLGCDGCVTTSSLCSFVEAVFIFGFGRRVFFLFF
jgi:hypothetical protein